MVWVNWFISTFYSTDYGTDLEHNIKKTSYHMVWMNWFISTFYSPDYGTDLEHTDCNSCYWSFRIQISNLKPQKILTMINYQSYSILNILLC